MRKASIVLRSLVIAYMAYLTFFLATSYLTPAGRMNLPFVLFALDMVNLFIHEGGHGVFKIFGQFIYALGGSLMQVILPVAAIVVFLRSGPRTLMWTLFWLGQNIVNISVYIMDAPYRQLRLISKYAIHDWGWITDYLGVTHLAEDFGILVLIVGLLACLGALWVGVYYVVRDVREEINPPLEASSFPPDLKQLKTRRRENIDFD